MSTGNERGQLYEETRPVRGRRRYLWSIAPFNVRISAVRKKVGYGHYECARTKDQQLDVTSIGLQEMWRADSRTFHAAGYQYSWFLVRVERDSSQAWTA